MDRDEWKKAISNANTYKKKYWSEQHENPKVKDLEYWRKKYLDEMEESMRLRKQCWELRDKLADIKELIRNLLKKAEK